MAIAPAPPRITPEDLLTLPDGDRFELVDGQLVEQETGAAAGWVAGRGFQQVAGFVEAAGAGWVFPAEVGYQCFASDAERVRRPDVSFIARGRLPGERIPRGHIRIAPDLAIEVVSPHDRFVEVDVKAEEYRAAGVRLIWVLNPDNRMLHVLRLDGSSARLHAEDELDGEAVLPGFRCRVADLFSPVSEATQ